MGRYLFAAGAVHDAQNGGLLFAWDRSGLGDERRTTYCAPNTALGLDALPEGRLLVASAEPCLSLLDARGEPIWTVESPILDIRWQADKIRVSEHSKVVDFGFGDPGTAVLRFDIGSLTLSSSPPDDGLTFVPNREGLTIDGWKNEASPTLDGRALPFTNYDIARSLAVTPDAKRLFLGSMYALAAFDDAGVQKWRQKSRNEVWAVNASKDGRVVVSADGDGAIRWHRADDGASSLPCRSFQTKKKTPPNGIGCCGRLKASMRLRAAHRTF